MNKKTQNRISRLAAEVRRLHRRHEPLNLPAAKRRFPDLVEAAYAVKPFLGWRKLLMAAEIAYEDIEREYLDYVVCRICGNRFGLLTEHLKKKHSVTAKEYRKKFPEAEMMAETLRAERRGWAKKPASPQNSLPHWEELWTPEYVLDRIDACRENGDPLNFGTMLKHDKSTANAAIRYFGSWDEAIARIGIRPEECRRKAPGISLTPEEVINNLKKRKQTGLPLNEKALVQSDLRLINAARRRFGSYVKALEAAGIEPRDVYLRKQYSDDDFNRVIKAGHRINKLVGNERLKALKKLDRQYRPAVYSRYKSWRVFAEKLGFDPDKFSFTEKEEDLIAVIKELPADMTAGRLFKENRSLYNKILRQIGPVSGILKKYHPVTHVLRKGRKKSTR